MSNIEIIKSEYPTACETYGCSNITDRLIGKPGESLGSYRVMCDECLQNLINAVPIEKIMNRSELKKEKFIPEDSIHGKIYDSEPGVPNPEYVRQEDDPIGLEDKLENVGKALEGENNLSELKYQQLKEIAAEKGIVVPFGTSKDDLIAMLEGD